MVVAPINFDINARAYLESLCAGQKPDIRPRFGAWESAVSALERVFIETVPEQRASTCQRMLQVLLRSKKYPDLERLFADTEMPVPRTEQGDVPVLPHYAQLSPALSQGACPELDWYEAFSRKASDRAWDQYHVFCGLWAFSVVAGRRVYLKMRRKKFYSNLMIAQCGTTSFYAKSFTAGIARQLLNELGLGYALAPNRITPQKLLSDMAGTHVPTNFDDLPEDKQDRIRRRLGMPGQKGLLYDELGLFIQSMLRKQSINADFADLLMSFDECPDEYESSTITRGGEPIDKPYLTLLGNMTPANLRQNAKQGADFWSDGFWARFSFVVAPPPPRDLEDNGPPQVSELDDLDLPFPPALLQSLKAWHERLGIPICHLQHKVKGDKVLSDFEIQRGDLPETECSISLEAWQAWTNYEYALRQMCLKLPHEDFNGSYVRLAETAMRIAVLLASLSNHNRIELCHWAKAQELAEILRQNLHELYAQINTSDLPQTLTATVEEKILAYVEKNQHEKDKDKIPTLRNLVRYIKGPSSGMLKSATLDLVRVQLLREEKEGKTTRYFPEDG